MRPSGRYCDQEKVKVLNRELNLTRDKATRDYGFAYILWLECGAVTPEPEKPTRLSAKNAHAMKAHIDSFNLWA